MEAAEVHRRTVSMNNRLPKFLTAVPGNALVFGTEVSILSFRVISGVLGGSRRAQVRLAIV